MATVNLDFNIEGASVIDLRNQLRGLKDAMGQATDPEQMARLAQAAGEVKDRIKEIDEQMNEFAAGSSFEKVNNNVRGIKDGLSNLDFDKVAASAKNLATNVGNIKPEELKNAFKGIGSAIGSLGKAFISLGQTLLANPIYLLATVIAGIIAVTIYLMDRLGYLEQITEGVGVAVDALVELLTMLGEAMGITAAKTEDFKKMQEATEEANKAVEKSTVDVIAVTNEVGNAFELAAKGVLTKEEALAVYNEKLGDVFGEATNLNEAEKLYVSKTGAYIKATMARAKAEVFAKKAAEEQAAALLAGTKDQTTALDKAIEFTEKNQLLVAASGGLGQAFVAGVELFADKTETLESRQAEGVKRAQDESNKRANIYTKAATDALTEAIDLEKEYNIKSVGLGKDLNKGKTDNIKRQLQEEIDLTEQIEKKKLDLLANGLEKDKKLRQQAFLVEATKILNDSIKTEREALKKKYEDGKISLETYQADVEKLEKEAINNLTEQERELYTLAQEQLNRDLLAIDRKYINEESLQRLEATKAAATSFEAQKEAEIAIINETARQALEAEGLTNDEITIIKQKQLDGIRKVEKEKQDLYNQAAQIIRETETASAANALANAKADLDNAKENSKEKIKLLEIYTQAVITQLETEKNARIAAIEEEIAALEEKRQKAEAGEGLALNDVELANLKKLEQDKANIQDEFRRQKMAADITAEEEIDKIRKTNVDKITEYAELASQGLQSIQAISDAIFTVKQTQLDEQQAQQLEALKTQQAAELASYTAGTAAYDQKIAEQQAATDKLTQAQADAQEELAKKQFYANKRMQLAGAIVDGFKAVTASLAAAPVAIGVVPNPAGIASLAFAITTSLANIAKIAATQYQGGGSSGGGPSAASPSISSPSTGDTANPSINLFGQGNDANTETFGKKSAPTFNVVATVSETDMTATQKRVAAMQANAEL